MKISAKQIDEIVRLLGTTAAAALSGAVIGFAGHGQISTAESVALTVYSVISFVLVITKGSSPGCTISIADDMLLFLKRLEKLKKSSFDCMGTAET